MNATAGARWGRRLSILVAAMWTFAPTPAFAQAGVSTTSTSTTATTTTSVAATTTSTASTTTTPKTSTSSSVFTTFPLPPPPVDDTSHPVEGIPATVTSTIVYPFETPFRGSTTTAAPVAPVEPLAVEQTTSTATLPPMTATPFVGPTPSLGASTTSLTPPQQVDESSTRWPAVLALGTLLVVGGPIAARRLHLFPTR